MSNLRDTDGPAEFEAALRKAFVAHRADFIFIDSRRMAFQLASASYGVERGWLRCRVHNEDEQSTWYEYRLTPQGRKYFGLPRKDR